MRRLLPLLMLALVLAGFLGANLTAQEVPTRIAFVDSQSLIAAHPAGRAANDLRALATEDLAQLFREIETLENKARSQGLNADEAERANTLVVTFESVQARYAADISAAAQPAVEAVNEAIRQVAAEFGVAIVLDLEAAVQSGMVVYADDSLDITDAVGARVQ